ncbi:MAG TPA: hypothetical protein VK191_07710 [Symbiobacteriaceae bacterium]|nr:hypothetical protein [Symbiobacteriaceae bacterium]
MSSPEVQPSSARSESPKEEAKDPRDNSVGNWLQIVGVLVGILGGFAGVFLGMGSGLRSDGNWVLGITVIISSGLSCLFFFGFAEIIFLLAKIAHNTAK